MRRRILKDRKDGYYLTKLDPVSKLMPYIMNDRTDAHVYFEDSIDLTKVEPFIREYRNEHKVKIGMMHLIIAAMVRTMSQKPKINRFVSGNKIYARNHISISYTMKKAMTEQASDAAVKTLYDPRATLHDIVRIVNEDIDANKTDDEVEVNADNSADVLAKVIAILPGFFIKGFISFVKFTDYLGILPRSILDASPFHTSMYITNLGSLGIKAVYHHIYNIGTTSMFLAFGVKKKEKVIGRDNSEEIRTFMDLKVTADERIVDGFYYATAFKLAIKLLENPERLLVPPVTIIDDTEI